MKDLNDYTVSPTLTLIQAVAKMDKNKARTVIVVKEDKVIGIVSEGDVLRALLRGADIHMPVLEVVNHAFKYLTEADDEQAFRLFQKHGFGLLPVLDEDFRLQDVLTLDALLGRAQLSAQA